jgi:transketolase
LDRSKYGSAQGLHKGAYVLADAGGTPDVILLASGSEVALTLSAHDKLVASGVKSRVVSVPCFEIFEQYCVSHPGYRDEVLPPQVRARVAIEMAAPQGWHRYVGCDGAVVAMNGFGASAPLKDLQKHFGFTTENVVATAREQIALHSHASSAR